MDAWMMFIGRLVVAGSVLFVLVSVLLGVVLLLRQKAVELSEDVQSSKLFFLPVWKESWVDDPARVAELKKFNPLIVQRRYCTFFISFGLFAIGIRLRPKPVQRD